MSDRLCLECAVRPLDRRNVSGYCGKCIGKVLMRNPEHRAKAQAGMRRRLQAEPELRAAYQERARAVQALPQSREARRQRWATEKPWLAGNAAQPAGSEPRRRAAARISATRLSWCPPHLRDQYRHLTAIKRFSAAEAREMILEQDRREVADVRRAMKYREPDDGAREPARIGRPPVWAECPDDLRPAYDRLRRAGVRSIEARRTLENAR